MGLLDRRNGCRLVLSALRSQWSAVAALVLTCPVAAHAAQSIAAVENAFADFNDAQGAVALIDSDPQRYAQFERKSRAEWPDEFACFQHMCAEYVLAQVDLFDQMGSRRQMH